MCVLADNSSSSQLAQSVASGGGETPASGFASGIRTSSGLAEARGIVLTSKLDKMSDSVT
jgi:Fe-S cluster assembly scaffold protein SufB